jgi:hypothetical protein
MLTVALLAMLLTSPAQGNATGPSKQVPQTTPSSDQYQGYRVIGTVVDSTTGARLGGAQVTITSLDTGDAAGMLTDENGRFVFEDVPAGKYVLSAKRKGYLEQLYKQHQQFSTAIITGPGLNTENLRFELRRGATLSGVVTDEAGEPVRNAQVSLFQQELFPGLRNTFQRGATITNDIGQFRFGGLLPGTYFLAVSATPWYAQRGQSYFINPPRNSDGAPQTDEPEMRVIPPEPQLDVVYPPTFFPNSPDLAGAAPIALRSGDAEVADIHLQAVPGSRMILRIPVTKESANVWANVTQQWIEGQTFNVAAAVQHIAPGMLEISGLPPGRVDVTVNSNGIPRWHRSVQVSDNNSEINIGEASRLVKVTGVARFADGLPPNVPLRFRLKSTTANTWYQLASQKDGTFELQQDGLPPGQYEILIMQSREAVVRNITATNAKVLSSRAFEITGAGDVKLEVLMSRGTGSITGFALKDGRPVDGVMVALVPDDSEHNPVLFRRDQSDSNGSFNLTGIHPGKYTLIALEDGWDIEWLEPGILKKYLAAGERVEVAPNAKLELKVSVQ